MQEGAREILCIHIWLRVLGMSWTGFGKDSEGQDGKRIKEREGKGQRWVKGHR